MADERKEDSEEVILEELEGGAGEDQTGTDPALKVRRLRDELKRCQHEKRDYLNTAQRLRADYLNLQKTEAAARAAAGQTAENGIIKDFLPILDSLDLALVNPILKDLPADWQRGLVAIRSNLLANLAKYGVEEIKALGQTFDPACHEAFEIAAAAEPAADQKIVAVTQKGYRRGDLILRPAGVKIAVYKSQAI